MKAAIISCIIVNIIIYISFSIYNLSFNIKNWISDSRESFSLMFSVFNICILMLYFLYKLMFEYSYKK